MIEKYTIGITNGNRNSAYDFPCSINDTFYTGSKIYFCYPLSQVNSLTGLSINSGNISSYNIAARLTYNSSGVPNTELVESSTCQIIDNFLVADLSAVLDELSHDYLLNIMNTDEIFRLSKNFYLSCIVGTSTQITSQLLTFQNTHFIQPFTAVLNTLESGPYSVKFKQVDLCDPNIFTTSERQQIFNNNPIMLGGETLRTFYPENLPNGVKSPLIFAFHGNNQLTENYDFILSHLASYGYVGCSVPIDQTIIGPEGGYGYAIKMIDHIKTNQSRIENGIFNNKLDFQKINLSGHSRGGDLIDLIALSLKYKNGFYSTIKNTSLSLSDIKCLFPIGQVTSSTIAPDGSRVAGTELSTKNPNASNISYFKRDSGIPTLSIRAKWDNQAGPEAHTSLMQTGYDQTLKLNTIDKGVLIIDNAEHAQLADYYFKDFVNGGPNGNFNRIETNNTFNSTSIPRNCTAAEILEFAAINNFSYDKLKKLRFIDYRINQRKNNFSSKIPYHRFFYNKNSDLKYMIHSFSGATSSFAGATGFTLTPSIGHTFDYAIDSDYFNVIHDGSYLEAEFNDLNIFRYNLIAAGGVDYDDQEELYGSPVPIEAFNGIMDFTYRGLFIPIESNVSMGYTFTSPINLSENNYLALRGALKTFYTPIQSGNTLDANFNITLIDTSANNSTLSSKNSSIGFEKNFKISPGNAINFASSSINNSIPNNIFFRAGDFVAKNPSLNINSIREIRFDFGPSYGSTFAHIAFDEFVVYNEL